MLKTRTAVAKSARPVGRRPRAVRLEGREQLLDAATSLFAERGIADTTVAQIAAAAKVTSAMVHYWFDTREKLLDAVVNERVAPMIEGFWQLGEAEHSGPLELVRLFVARVFDVTEARPWIPALWLREIVQDGGLLRARVLKRIPRDRFLMFSRTIRAAQVRGAIHPQIIPELVVFSLLGLAMLPQASRKSWSRINPALAVELDRAKLEAHVAALLTHGLAGPAGHDIPSPRSRS